MTAVTCQICGREGAHLVQRPFHSIYNGVPIRLEQAEMYECEFCGESVFNPGQDREVSERVKSAAREQLGLLSPQDIARIRKSRNISQEELERLLDLEEGEVGRWEQGRRLQSKTADLLLRLLERNPATLEDLRAIHPGQDEPQSTSPQR